MTRDDVLDAAAQVFRQKGFHGASMSDIAAAVNVQKASLYHHVSSKQEILLALLDRALAMLTEHISSISSQNISPDQKLRLMIRGYLTGLATRAIMGTLNWTLTWYHPNGPKSIEQIADEYSDFILKGMLK